MDVVGLEDRRLRLLPAGVVPPALQPAGHGRDRGQTRGGGRAHREIGLPPDLVRAVGAVQTALFIAIAVVLVLLAALVLRALP